MVSGVAFSSLHSLLVRYKGAVLWPHILNMDFIPLQQHIEPIPRLGMPHHGMYWPLFRLLCTQWLLLIDWLRPSHLEDHPTRSQHSTQSLSNNVSVLPSIPLEPIINTLTKTFYNYSCSRVARLQIMAAFHQCSQPRRPRRFQLVCCVS